MSDLEWRREVDRTIKELKRRTAHLQFRPSPGGRASTSGGGGSGDGGDGVIGCPTVYSLPAIPTTAETIRFVYWTSEDEEVEEGEEGQEGTGDNGVWWAREGMTRWYPMTYSTLSGAPPEEEP